MLPQEIEDTLKEFKEKLTNLGKSVSYDNKEWLSYVSNLLGRTQVASALGHVDVEIPAAALIAVLERHVSLEMHNVANRLKL